MSPAESHYYSAEYISTLAPRAALPWTICILFYGDYPVLCRRALDRLYRYTDPAAFRLRIGLNEVSKKTKSLVEAAAEKYGNVSIYESEENIYKYPMMRRLFHSPPIDTEWTIWFDDDSYVRGSSWIADLSLAMERHRNAEVFGSMHFVDVGDRLEEHCKKSRWDRGIPRKLHPDHGQRIITFPTGAFWAVRTARIMELDWPDPRIEHHNGDTTMGEAMRQQGVEMADFHSGVCIDDAPRRSPKEVPTEVRVDYDPE